MRYEAHARLTDAARPSAAPWRIALGAFLIALLYIGLGYAYFALIAGVVPGGLANPVFLEIAEGSTALGLIVLLVTFGFLLSATGVVMRLLHHRPLAGLIGNRAQALRDFWVVTRFLAPLQIGVLFLVPAQFEQNMPFALWLLWLPLSLPLVLLQVSAEEVAFRGYLQQHLAAWTGNPIVWMGVPSILFALGHYDTAEAGGNAVFIALWTACFGVLAADLTARTGTLGAAIALHFVNNVVAILIASVASPLSGLALYTYPFTMGDEAEIAAIMPLDFLAMLVSWLAARLALRV